MDVGAGLFRARAWQEAMPERCQRTDPGRASDIASLGLGPTERFTRQAFVS
jgi:hypothetical protein